MATQTIRTSIILPAGTYYVNVQLGSGVSDTYTNLTLSPTANPSCWSFQVTSAAGGLYSFNIFNDADELMGFGWFWSDADITTIIRDSNTPEGAAMNARLDKMPQIGKTMRYTRTNKNTLTVDVAITSPP